MQAASSGLLEVVDHWIVGPLRRGRDRAPPGARLGLGGARGARHPALSDARRGGARLRRRLALPGRGVLGGRTSCWPRAWGPCVSSGGDGLTLAMMAAAAPRSRSRDRRRGARATAPGISPSRAAVATPSRPRSRSSSSGSSAACAAGVFGVLMSLEPGGRRGAGYLCWTRTLRPRAARRRGRSSCRERRRPPAGRGSRRRRLTRRGRSPPAAVGVGLAGARLGPVRAGLPRTGGWVLSGLRRCGLRSGLALNPRRRQRGRMR